MAKWKKGESGNKKGRPTSAIKKPKKTYSWAGMSNKIYLMRHEHGFYKIGVTRNPARRMVILQCSTPYLVDLFFVAEADNALEMEAHLHQVFRDNLVRGEWFALGEEEVEFALSYIQEHRMMGDVNSLYTLPLFSKVEPE